MEKFPLVIFEGGSRVLARTLKIEQVHTSRFSGLSSVLVNSETFLLDVSAAQQFQSSGISFMACLNYAKQTRA